jgi:hypothetical protein
MPASVPVASPGPADPGYIAGRCHGYASMAFMLPSSILSTSTLSTLVISPQRRTVQGCLYISTTLGVAIIRSVVDTSLHMCRSCRPRHIRCAWRPYVQQLFKAQWPAECGQLPHRPPHLPCACPSRRPFTDYLWLNTSMLV